MPNKKIKNITADFFVRPTLIVARELLGKVIIRQTPAGLIIARIVETEAYIGEEDGACHARFGRTARSEPMYLRGGRTYIYLIYGLYNLLNFVTEEENIPAAVLIRKIEPLSAPDPQLKSYGPGNLTKFLQIDRTHNNLEVGNEISLVDDGFEPKTVIAAERIGVEYSGEWARKKWRYILNK